MTIQKNDDGNFEATCTRCGCDVEFDDGEIFDEVVWALRNDKWKIEKHGDNWTHVCPDCFYGNGKH